MARVVNDELQAALTGASVRTEAFITLVVPEARLGKAAKEAGGGVEGRARVLYSLMAECDAQLRGAVGMTARGVADLAPAGRRVPHRVRPRRPGRDHRRPDRPHHRPRA